MLALKYRPQKLSEVKGQQHVIQTIQHAVQQQKLPTAIILSGIRGTGKTTLARVIAKILNCQKPDQGDACGTCASCVMIQNNNHLDVLEIDAATHTGVEHVRDLVTSAQYKPVQGAHRVYIIDEAHMLSRSAFNALLKSLEESDTNAYYILATTELHKIPSTILSRCMQLNLQPFTYEQAHAHIQTLLQVEGYTVENEALAQIIDAAQGSMRDALTLLNHVMLFASSKHIGVQDAQSIIGTIQHNECLDLLSCLLKGDVEQALTLLRTMVAQVPDAIMILEYLLNLVYWLCCLKQAPHLQTAFAVDKEQGMALASNLKMSTLLHTWQVLNKGYQEYIQAPLKQQTLEMILMRVCFAIDLPALQATENTRKKFDTFEELVALAKKSKELLLYTTLCHNMVVVHYAPGHITCDTSGMSQQAQSLLVQQLKELTGIPWQVTMKYEGRNESLSSIEDKQYQSTLQAFQELPTVKSILSTFPQTEIVFKKKEKE